MQFGHDNVWLYFLFRGPVYHSSWGIGIDVPASVHVCRGVKSVHTLFLHKV